MNEIKFIAEKLISEHSLSKDEYALLIRNRTPEIAEMLLSAADKERRNIYSNKIFLRGLIEVSNYCKNDCLYCGIRRGNVNCSRYRLTKEDILTCAEEGYSLGFRTFVLQGGEDAYYNDERLCDIIESLKTKYPECAVTLSLGERSRESYNRLFEAGADRYLLRHETADEAHYKKLHPDSMSFKNRIECLYNLKEIGYQTGCGFMVGSPYQTDENIAADLKFIETFSPDMCGIGPFIPHKETPFAAKRAGTVELTCFLLSVIRLIKPNILLPSTTALGTIAPDGREKGILAGANVIMPNLSPVSVRKKYELYDNKICTGEESAQCRQCLETRIKSIGFEIVNDRGDIKLI